MPTVTQSIGTTGRDWSDISSWEAQLDNAAYYSAGDDAVGECYNDSVFDESVTINGGGTIGLNSVTLTVASGERHDGTAGTGARIVRSAATEYILNMGGTNGTRNAKWLELDAAQLQRNGYQILLEARHSGLTCSLQNMLVHGGKAYINNGPILCNMYCSSGSSVSNSLFYDTENIYGPNTVTVIGIRREGGTGQFYNCTVHDIRNDGTSTGNAVCVEGADVSGFAAQNILATSPAVAGSGTAECFSESSYSTATVDHNASSDATASGTGSLTNITAADQFVSTSPVDLHLKSGADCIDAGTDLGTTPSGVEIAMPA